MTENARTRLDDLFREVLERMPGSDTAAAEQMRVNSSYLSLIRHGRSRPSLKTAKQLVGVLEDWRSRCERDRKLLQRAIAEVEEQETTESDTRRPT